MKYYLIPSVYKIKNNESNVNEPVQSAMEANNKISLNFQHQIMQSSIIFMQIYHLTMIDSRSIITSNKYDDPLLSSYQNNVTFFYMSIAFIVGTSQIFFYPPKSERNLLNQITWMFLLIAPAVQQEYDYLTTALVSFWSGFAFVIINTITNVQLYEMLPQYSHQQFFSLKGIDTSLSGLILIFFIYVSEFAQAYIIACSLLLTGVVLFQVFNRENTINRSYSDPQSAETLINEMTHMSGENFEQSVYNSEEYFSKFNSTRCFYQDRLFIKQCNLVKKQDEQQIEKENQDNSKYLQKIESECIIKENYNKGQFEVFKTAMFTKYETQFLLTASFLQESTASLIVNLFQIQIREQYISSASMFNQVFIYGSAFSLILFILSIITLKDFQPFNLLIIASIFTLLMYVSALCILSFDLLGYEANFQVIIALVGVMRWRGFIANCSAKVNLDQILPEQKSQMQTLFMMVRCVGMFLMMTVIKFMNMEVEGNLCFVLFVLFLHICCYIQLQIDGFYK